MYNYKIIVNEEVVVDSNSIKDVRDFFSNNGVEVLELDDDNEDLIDDFIFDEDRCLGSVRVYNKELCEYGDDYIDLEIDIVDLDLI